MFHVDKLTDWEKEAIISFFLVHSPESVRDLMARALPLPFNKLYGKEIMRVEYKQIPPKPPAEVAEKGEGA